MPTINVKKDLLMQQLGTVYTDEQFDELCFKFGIELDEITSEKKMALKEKSQTGNESDDIIYKIDIPANRYDLLSVEGLVLALRIFCGSMKPPEYKVKSSNLEFFVDEHANAVRPVLLAAVVRNVKFNQNIYDSFIDLQDKIHQNIGRKRSLVSIGTHDLDTIQGPFLYTAMNPEKLKFVPLNQTKEFTASQLMNFYADTYLKPYLPLIRDKPEYPVILDKNQVVLSMPPIINGDKTKITLKTKNILIEVTATDRSKATIALNTLLTMITSSNGSFEAETVQIKHFDGRCFTSPDLSYHNEIVETSYINRGLGLNLNSETITTLLTKMSLKAKVIDTSGDRIQVGIPPTRQDIIHKCDIMEDVGIAYGYDNIEKTLPKCATIATQVPLNKVSDQLRHEVARCGFTEALNFALCSENELASMLRRPDSKSLVKIQNPKTLEFQVARTCLLSGILKTINSNKKMPLPMKIFEISDVVLADNNSDVGARNERHLAAVYYGKQSSGFEIIHGLLDRIMSVLECKYIGEDPNRSNVNEGYYIRATDESAYFPGRCAEIIYNSQVVGHLGTLHPEVLSNFELNHPSSALEIDIEKIIMSQLNK